MPWNELLSCLNGHANVFTYEFLPVEVWFHNYCNYKAYESHHQITLLPQDILKIAICLIPTC